MRTTSITTWGRASGKTMAACISFLLQQIRCSLSPCPRLSGHVVVLWTSNPHIPWSVSAVLCNSTIPCKAQPWKLPLAKPWDRIWKFLQVSNRVKLFRGLRMRGTRDWSSILPWQDMKSLPRLGTENARYVKQKGSSSCLWAAMGNFLQSSEINLAKYTHFVFLNSGLRGPFLPVYSKVRDMPRRTTNYRRTLPYTSCNFLAV